MIVSALPFFCPLIDFVFVCFFLILFYFLLIFAFCCCCCWVCVVCLFSFLFSVGFFSPLYFALAAVWRWSTVGTVV